jgi:chromosome segregation ATPase
MKNKKLLFAQNRLLYQGGAPHEGGAEKAEKPVAPTEKAPDLLDKALDAATKKVESLRAEAAKAREEAAKPENAGKKAKLEETAKILDSRANNLQTLIDMGRKPAEKDYEGRKEAADALNAQLQTIASREKKADTESYDRALAEAEARQKAGKTEASALGHELDAAAAANAKATEAGMAKLGPAPKVDMTSRTPDLGAPAPQKAPDVVAAGVNDKGETVYVAAAKPAEAPAVPPPAVAEADKDKKKGGG